MHMVMLESDGDESDGGDGDESDGDEAIWQCTQEGTKVGAR